MGDHPAPATAVLRRKSTETGKVKNRSSPARRRAGEDRLGAAGADHSGGYVIDTGDTMPRPGLRRFGATSPRERGNVTGEGTPGSK